jgi:hypothetical protein
MKGAMNMDIRTIIELYFMHHGDPETTIEEDIDNLSNSDLLRHISDAIEDRIKALKQEPRL